MARPLPALALPELAPGRELVPGRAVLWEPSERARVPGQVSPGRALAALPCLGRAQVPVEPLTVPVVQQQRLELAVQAQRLVLALAQRPMAGQALVFAMFSATRSSVLGLVEQRLAQIFQLLVVCV